MAELSVLMSIYLKEKPEYVDECFKSLLRQTVKANEWVVVEDGPLTEEMYHVLDQYQIDYPGLLKRVPLEKNQGLGLALKAGVSACSYELIARMDTDDIARDDRFETQILEFKNNPKLDVCGSHIIEFEGNPEHVLSVRKGPLTHEGIVQYQKTRSAFNHMSVMFKKSSVLKAGNYEHCPLMEDDLLWTRMILSGAVCSNINDYLVYARTGSDMIARRGGWDYFKKYKQGKDIIKGTGFIGTLDYWKAILPQLAVSLMPVYFRKLLFVKLLR